MRHQEAILVTEETTFVTHSAMLVTAPTCLAPTTSFTFSERFEYVNFHMFSSSFARIPPPLCCTVVRGKGACYLMPAMTFEGFLYQVNAGDMASSIANSPI